MTAIGFSTNERDELTVFIDTERVHIESVQEKDCEDYKMLFGDAAVMEKFATGQIKTPEQTAERVQGWIKRWQQQQDPYSALAAFKNDTDDFLGHVVLGHGDAAGQSELAYLFKKSHWNQGYGSEIVKAVVKDYAPETVKRGYKLEGKTLEIITATSRPDNFASKKILEEKIGMYRVGEEIKFNALRYHYAISLEELQKS